MNKRAAQKQFGRPDHQSTATAQSAKPVRQLTAEPEKRIRKRSAALRKAWRRKAFIPKTAIPFIFPGVFGKKAEEEVISYQPKFLFMNRIIFLFPAFIAQSFMGTRQTCLSTVHQGWQLAVKYKKLHAAASNADIVFFGELHDNPIAHWLQLNLPEACTRER